MTGSRHLPLASWLRLLADDGRILLSWFVLIGSGIYAAYVFSGKFGAQPTSLSPTEIWQRSLFGAYWGWSMYWGVPGCLGFLNRGKNRLLAHGFSPATILALFFYCGFAFFVIFYYPPLGGGIFHFFQRWWSAARQLPPPMMAPPAVNVMVQPPMMVQQPMMMQQPPIPPAPYPTADVERRLRELAGLLQRGSITQQEHDQQRMNILRTL